MFQKKLFRKISQNNQKMLLMESNRQLYLKKIPAKVFSSEIREVFKKIYLTEHLRDTGFLFTEFAK